MMQSVYTRWDLNHDLQVAYVARKYRDMTLLLSMILLVCTNTNETVYEEIYFESLGRICKLAIR